MTDINANSLEQNLATFSFSENGKRHRPNQRPRIVVAASTKGGVGKTLMITQLAGEFAYRGYNVVVLDGDVNEDSLFGTQALGFPNLHVCVTDPDSVVRNLKDVRSNSNIDIVLVDTSGGSSHMQTKVMVSADFVLIPSRKKTLDVKNALSTFSVLTEAEDMLAQFMGPEAKVPYGLVWNDMPTHAETQIMREVSEEMVATGRNVLRSVVNNSTAFDDSIGFGKTVRELHSELVAQSKGRKNRNKYTNAVLSISNLASEITEYIYPEDDVSEFAFDITEEPVSVKKLGSELPTDDQEAHAVQLKQEVMM